MVYLRTSTRNVNLQPNQIMKEIVIISKANCAPCVALKQFVSTLPECSQEKVSIMDDENSSEEDRYNIIQSYGLFGFPTIIHREAGKDDVAYAGFGANQLNELKVYLECKG